MACEPEPLERVRALVCANCWVNWFDTKGFEKLGRGDIDEFKYDVSVARGHYATIRMIKGLCGLRLQQSPRKSNEHNVG